MAASANPQIRQSRRYLSLDATCNEAEEPRFRPRCNLSEFLPENLLLYLRSSSTLASFSVSCSEPSLSRRSKLARERILPIDRLALETLSLLPCSPSSLPLRDVLLSDTGTLSLGEESGPTSISNDAATDVQVENSLEAERRLPHEVAIISHGEAAFVQFLDQIKHPAKSEWENLWYHGVEPAFREVAHYFPEHELETFNSTVDESISEPALELSRLNKEDQEACAQERVCSVNSFTPNSETERLFRLQRAENATDEREKVALLLGLPTFEEYTESKHQLAKETPKSPTRTSQRQLKREAKFAQKRVKRQPVQTQQAAYSDKQIGTTSYKVSAKTLCHSSMTHQSTQATSSTALPVGGAEHRPLVVGLKKPQSIRSVNTMAASSSDAAALNREIEANVKENTTAAAPAEESSSASTAPKPKKEKAPKQPKPPKAAAPVAPTSPALIDLRVGHILRAIAHPNADSLYVSTIAMGDPEGTEHTQIDEETGKVVRTVCSGLNGLVPLEDMQDRKIIVVANLKPVNMRSIKSAAMVLAASPKQPEGADSHAADRIVELVIPPEGSEAGDKVYFEGWPYGDGKGPEKTLNPKKKQWEAIQPGFYTSEDLVVGFDAGHCDDVDGSDKGNLVVEGKGNCTVKTLKGAVVR